MKKQKALKIPGDIGMNRKCLEVLGVGWVNATRTEAVLLGLLSRMAGKELTEFDRAARNLVYLESLNDFQRGVTLCLDMGVAVPPDLLEAANLNLKRPPSTVEIH